ncbi:MAG: glycoside hydrolase, partial [Acidobacteriota bacterium]
PPSVENVVLHDVRISGGGKISFSGYDHTHRIGALLNGVQITDDAKYSYAVSHADLRLGPDPTNLQLSAGTDSTIQGKPADGTPASCTAMFAPFPK